MKLMKNNLIKKSLTIIFLFAIFCIIFMLNTQDKIYKVKNILSPNNIITENGTFSFKGYNTFDSVYSENNKNLAKKFALTEDEAFILGNFGKFWAKNLLESEYVKTENDNLIYYKISYKTKFLNSPYCIKENSLCNKSAFEKQLNTIRKGKFVLVNTDDDTVHEISKNNAYTIKNYIIVRKSHVKHLIQHNKPENIINHYKTTLDLGIIKIILADLTTKIYPDRNCSSDICKEILYNINSTQKTLDIAIYGYSSTPAIEKALKSAINRGVKIRLVYDQDSAGNNIYPDTFKFIKLLPDNRSDKNSSESAYTMHNKFYIFDSKTVITGSANLSHTDMSGFNSNSIIVIKSPEIAKFYTKEFENMYSGKFHNEKVSVPNKKYQNIKIYFSPQDKPIKNEILPIIKNAKKYIYIPTFVITEKRIIKELINAKNRGVEIKIISDALNASNKHSGISYLRKAGIPVKAENYAGKMHTKMIITDDEYLIIGSMNFSNSGENKNDENILILKNPKAAKFCKNFFLYQWNRIPDKWLKQIPRAEGKDSIGSCSDGLDNNYDGQTDTNDVACK